MTDALPTPPSAARPAEPSRPEAPVQLAGGRLALAWAVFAFVAGAGVAPLVAALPTYTAIVLEADPAFLSLHADVGWRPPLRIAPTWGGGVAAEAGLPSGTLVAVGGQPLGPEDGIVEAARLAAGPVGTPVALTVETEAGERVTATIARTDALPPAFRSLGMTWRTHKLLLNAVHLAACLVFLIAAVLLVVRQPRGLVALLGATAFLWFGFADTFDQIGALIDWDRMPWAVLGWSWAPSLLCLTLFLAVFPDGRARPRWGLVPTGLLVGYLGFAFGVPAFLVPVFGALQVGLFVVGFGVAVAAQAVRYRRHATDAQRQQTKWALWGLAGGIGCLTLATLLTLVPVEPGSGAARWKQLVYEVVWAGSVLLPVGVTVSLLRYRLWGAEAAWSRSAMAAALTLALTAIVAGGTALLQAALGASGPLALALATAAAALVVVPLQRRLSDWADHRFLRDLTDLKERLPDLVAHLRETESVEGIAEAVTDRVAPAVHAAHVALVVPEGEGWRTVGTEGIAPASADAWAESVGLSSPPAMAPRRRQPWRAVIWREPGDRLFPIRVALRAERGGGEVATEGWLLLGPRPDGSGYGPDDLEAVAEVAGAIGRALRVVRVREARAAAQRDRADALADGVRQLRDDLAALRAALPDRRPEAT